MSEAYGHLSVKKAGEKIILSSRHSCIFPHMCKQHIPDAALSEEEQLKRQDKKTKRTVLRAQRHFFAMAMSNQFLYYVTLSFNESLSSAYGFDIVDKFSRWMSDRFRRKGISVKYYLVVVPNEVGQWHIHLLLGDVPEGEFCPLRECHGKITIDALQKIEHGAILYGWKAFNKHFDSLSYIQKFGEFDENHQVVCQEGKVRYIEHQFLKHTPDLTSEALSQRLKFYRDFIPQGKQPYRHSRNLKKPQKIFSDNLPMETIKTIYDTLGITPGPMGINCEISFDNESLSFALPELFDNRNAPKSEL